MSGRILTTLALAVLPLALHAQSAPMDGMPGMAMPGQPGNSTEASAPAHDHATSQETSGNDHSMHDMVMPVNGHVSPPPPALVMHDMTPAQMTELMQMDDAAPLGMLLVDRLERSRSTDGDYATNWEAEGWWGNAIDRVWFKTEGERGSDGTQDGRIDLLWSHALSAFWDGQLGVRQDFGQGPNRQWLALGAQGLAPYWFETQATFYAGEEGRTALRLEASYEWLFTQRLILEPKLEMNLYGKDDPQRGIRSGLSDMEAGLRLRYEFSRKFAPYIGVQWMRRWGDLDQAGTPAWHARETTWVAGVRLWF
ncbi:copper resistance protein B [Dyella sp. C9]|uniref:copper resistance protein B n=1 Tax=Dyella sp. C9 TaxID=2202154 RepID=UPI000DEF9A19|nr:copper resistance protein B [Dyella sp. C9]